jgi:aminobutyraldehyde dehydrogenase
MSAAPWPSPAGCATAFTWVNTHGVGTPEMPWAAMKGSGTGCDMSVYALDAYTSIRHVMVAH